MKGDQLTLDAQLAKALKHQALDAIEEREPSFLMTMRLEAIRIAQRQGWVTSDDLRSYAARQSIEPVHPNVWGAVWRMKGWVVVGHRKSAVPSSHAREIKIYRWEG